MSCCIDQTDGEPAGSGLAAEACPRVLRLLPGFAAGMSNLGLGAAISGAISFPAPAATNRLTRTSRATLTSAVGAGSTSGVRSGVLFTWRGNAAGVGGFRIRYIFAVSVFVSGFRAFVGMRNATAVIGAVDPSSLTDIFGMAYDLGQTQWRIMHNDAAGAATQIPLGAAFNVDATHLLQLELLAEPNASAIEYTATNLSTGDVATGSVGAEIPSNTTFLSSNEWVNTGNVAGTAAAIDHADACCELLGT